MLIRKTGWWYTSKIIKPIQVLNNNSILIFQVFINISFINAEIRNVILWTFQGNKYIYNEDKNFMYKKVVNNLEEHDVIEKVLIVKRFGSDKLFSIAGW